MAGSDKEAIYKRARSLAPATTVSQFKSNARQGICVNVRIRAASAGVRDALTQFSKNNDLGR